MINLELFDGDNHQDFKLKAQFTQFILNLVIQMIWNPKERNEIKVRMKRIVSKRFQKDLKKISKRFEKVLKKDNFMNRLPKVLSKNKLIKKLQFN